MGKSHKAIYSLILLAAAGLLIWRFALPLQKATRQLPAALENFASSTMPTQIQNLEQQIFAPPPLKGPTSAPASAPPPVLTQSGVIYWTNINRKNNGNLPALTENAKLDLAAENKLKDMFSQQYFEHINPQGKGPSDLAAAVGYAYISIGENLAEGYFQNDQDLLTAWMNSPGHRANILNAKFVEMGAAVGQGMFGGQQAWIAVQEFGRPASACPGIDSNLKLEIKSLEADAAQLQTQLTALKAEIDADNPQTQADYDAYNAKVAQYNSIITNYNNKVDAAKLAGAQYNAEVNAYNACLAN
jgi:uncharacterized protein YkwD